MEITSLYKCKECKRVVEIKVAGKSHGCCSVSLEPCDLACCGTIMEKLTPHDKAEEGNEKHVPVVESVGDGIVVKVGSKEHPMETNHYIQMIEVMTKDQTTHTKYLTSADKPEAKFNIPKENVYSATAYCNLHGLLRTIL